MTDPRQWSEFTRSVVLERARLALVDPDGEALAVRSLDVGRAIRVIKAVMALERLPRRQARTTTTKPANWDNESLLGRLGVLVTDTGRGIVRCPAHEDRHASLSWRLSGDRLLLRCFAGCTFTEIVQAVS